MILNLDTPVSLLPMVGKKRAELLATLSIFTISDLLTYYPRGYQDRSKLTPISALKGKGRETIAGQVMRHIRFGKVKRAIISDGRGVANLMFFGGDPAKLLPLGTRVIVTGKAKRMGGKIFFSNFEYEVLKEEPDSHLRIVPLYRLSGDFGAFGQRLFRKIISSALDLYKEKLEDSLPPEIAEHINLISLSSAISNIHFPESWRKRKEARERIVFTELFLLQTALQINRQRTKTILKNRLYSKKDCSEFLKSLPFSLTKSQERVILEIEKDLSSPHPMNRFLHGDVGSGKTVVALWAGFKVASSGFQVAIMAPTEILADQHYIVAKRWLAPLGIEVGILRGGLSASLQKRTKELIASRKIQVVIGTHSLISEDVQFCNLALCIIDEQHKFGVSQRQKLIEKASGPCDMLIMTATPIPRTLSLTLYGDMDVSTLNELPKGRGRIITAVRSDKNLPKIYSFIREEIKKERQAYFVYPAIEESQERDYKSAIKHFEKISLEFPEIAVGLLHGKLKPDEKEEMMQKFAKGEVKILVSTTVIEVGIDVSQATIMVIEDAEKFGLSQLHQLRGRIGRGGFDSYCILITKEKIAQVSSSETKVELEEQDKLSVEKIRAIKSITNGFELAEYDLKLRGAGELFGLRQHGLSELKLANIIWDAKWLFKARDCAAALVADDPLLNKEPHLPLRDAILRIFGKKMELGFIR
ncbi:ATP-dependent DNA helicase RecG [bacterium]|nr:ATP-dependent DNA helicase RecG [bacterium]